MAATDTAARIRPYVERLVENDYVQENIRDAAANLRAAYARASKRRVKPARDEKLRRQVRQAAVSLNEATQALRSGRRKPKRRPARRLLIVLGVGALGAAAALAASEDLRRKLFGGESKAGPATTPAAEPSAPVAA
jgi:thiamine pyrophosphate-dependent acetolactate synthase large subunit-like protein